MADLDDKDLEDKGTEDEPEDKPDLPTEPVDKNESIDVQVQDGPSRAEKKRNRERLEEIKRKREMAAKQKAEEAQKVEEQKRKQEEML